MRLYTEEEFRTLSQYRSYFETAQRNWARRMSGTDADTILRIYKDASGDRHRQLNKGCGTCVLHLLQDAGKIFFDTAEFFDKTK